MRAESFENDMREFREEVSALMGDPTHLKEEFLNVEELTGSDAAIYEEFKNGTLTKEELAEYDSEVRASQNVSRRTFLGMINNKMMAMWTDEENERAR